MLTISFTLKIQTFVGAFSVLGVTVLSLFVAYRFSWDKVEDLIVMEMSCHD